jgi:MinD-like ATPase involved in chromosome partitioning or flagellar assembly
MGKIISIHSFRGGTGKSNSTANIAALLAADGRRVGIVDTDINSPGIHVLFGVNEDLIKHSLNDYLWGKCAIKDTAVDVTPLINNDPANEVHIKGTIYLIPSSMRVGEIARIIREGYDVGLLNDGYEQLIADLKLDVLVIDTHPGLNEETLLSVAISDALVVIMRPDQQDYQGTSVTIEVARKLNVPRMLLVVNKAPQSLDLVALKKEVGNIYQIPVGAIIPHSDEMMTLASAGIFSMRYPDHEVAQLYREVAQLLIAD